MQGYLKDSCLTDDFMDVKDFFYNIVKSLCISTILDSKDYRARFVQILFDFIDKEYTPLHFSRHVHIESGNDLEAIRLDRMTYANMVETEEYKKYRR